jgi:7-methyl-GTP pyrophosphatase
MPRLILASTSRYRRDLLARLKIPFDVVAPGVEETDRAGEPPASLAARLAAAKAESVTATDAIVVGSDQVASLAGERLRKPGDHATAMRQLLACQGRSVVFHTAITVIDRRSDRSWSHVDRTDVWFATRSRDELDRYLKIEQPYDCAGSFKAEALGIALFERIATDDPTALMGLPLIWLARTLKTAGLDPLAAEGTARAPSRG